jgi:hypothetical protein
MQPGSISNFGIYRARQLIRTKELWRDAARLVSTRWDVFLQCEAQTRALAFASYLAALDAEEAAAAEIARLIGHRQAPRRCVGPRTSPLAPDARSETPTITNKGAS